MSKVFFNIAVFCSGIGSNLEYIIEACNRSEYVYDYIPGRVKVVVTDGACLAVDKAILHKIPVFIIPMFMNRERWNRMIVESLSKLDIDLICLAGFMKILGREVVSSYTNKIINLHPGLLPLLAGKDPQRRALEMKLKTTGNTIHIVTEVVDVGEILETDCVLIEEGETEESLSAKLKDIGHATYIKAIQRWYKDYFNKGKEHETKN